MKILQNARIYTLESACPLVSALAMDAGKVIAVGGGELLSRFRQIEPEDMNGQVILPGLTDAHLHLQEYALSLQMVNCEGLSIPEILERLAGLARTTSPGTWLRGHGWNQNTWGGAWPTAAELDGFTPHHPVYLTAKSLHAGWANSAALRSAGISASSPDPANGLIQRDESGSPTGIVFEAATKLVEAAIPEPTPEDLAKIFRQIIPHLLSMGLTGVHDFDKRVCFMALQLLWAHGDLPLRVIKSIPLESFSQALELGLQSGFGDDRLRIGSLKLFADGALGTRTGAMFAPYLGEAENCGLLILDAERLFELGRQAVEGGISLAVHAIGDRAVHEVLDGFTLLREYESSRGLPPMRHRMEHVQNILPEDAGRLAELGIIASMQPVHAPSDMFMADELLGERESLPYAWRTLLDYGARLAFGSDAPVESPNPFWGLHAAVTRRRLDGSPGPHGWRPGQRLPLASALEGFTVAPAYAAGMEDRLGRLAPGYWADLIVLGTDPFTCDPAELHSIRPVASMVAGEWVWPS